MPLGALDQLSFPSALAQLAVHPTFQHLDCRTILRVRKVETNDFGRCAGGGVVKLENGAPSGFEKTVTGLQYSCRFAFPLEIEAPVRHHSDGRHRVAVPPGRLTRREFNAGAFDQMNRRICRGQLFLKQRFAFESGEGCVGHGNSSPGASRAGRYQRCSSGVCQKEHTPVFNVPPSPFLLLRKPGHGSSI
jgi:hypothetical protein